MEQFTLPGYDSYALCILVCLLVYGYAALRRAVAGAARQKLPPGPWQLPIIGSLHHLLLRGRHHSPHRSMRDLSLRHGPLMLFRVCERAVVVVSSAEAAREIYKANDAAFSERPGGPGVDELSRHGHGIILAPYGDHWRLVRRVLVTELLTPRRVASFRRVREEEAARLISSILPQAAAGLVVNVGERLSEFTAGATVRPIFGDRMPAESAAFMRCVRKAADLASLFDLRDLFPSGADLRPGQPGLQPRSWLT